VLVRLIRDIPMVKKNKNQPKQASKKAAPKKAAAKGKAPKRSRKPNNSQGAGGLSITSVNEGVGFKIKPFTQQDSTIEGCDYLHTITIGATDPAVSNSAVVYSVPINPLAINPLTRLAAMAALYDNFQVVSISFHFATSVSTSTDGSMVMAWDADPDDNYTAVTGDALNTYLDSTSCNVNFSLYRNAFLTVPASKKLFVQAETGGDQRLVNHGRLWVATQGGVAAGTYGRILMKWRIKFMKPNLDPDNTTASYAATIVAPNGTYISATYPFGDFSSIIANVPANLGLTYNPEIVQFTSLIPGTATPASVFVFKRAGKYRLIMSRVGVAIGVTAYTFTGAVGCTFGGSGPTAAGYPYSGVGTQSIANSAATATLGYVDVNATGGGYVWATGDSGPSHTSSIVTVMSFPATDVNPPPGMLSFEAQEIQRLRFLVENMLLPKKTPAPLLDNMTSTTTTTYSSIPSPAGEPVKSWNSVANTTGSVGPVDVVVLDPPPVKTTTFAIEALTPAALMPKPERLPFTLPPGYTKFPHEEDDFKPEGIYKVVSYPKLESSYGNILWQEFNDGRAKFFMQDLPYWDKEDLHCALAQINCDYSESKMGRMSDLEFAKLLLPEAGWYPDDRDGPENCVKTQDDVKFWEAVALGQCLRLIDVDAMRMRHRNYKCLRAHDLAKASYERKPDPDDARR
jgi:hypothetical protein